MKKETFKLIDALNCEGPEFWGVVEGVNTRRHFGTEESIYLNGQFLYVYQKEDEFFCFLDKFTPDYSLSVGTEKLNLYKLD